MNYELFLENVIVSNLILFKINIYFYNVPKLETLICFPDNFDSISMN